MDFAPDGSAPVHPPDCPHCKPLRRPAGVLLDLLVEAAIRHPSIDRSEWSRVSELPHVDFLSNTVEVLAAFVGLTFVVSVQRPASASNAVQMLRVSSARSSGADVRTRTGDLRAAVRPGSVCESRTLRATVGVVLEPTSGLEPLTCSLRVSCSTT
jgi:hypothetical protein